MAWGVQSSSYSAMTTGAASWSFATPVASTSPSTLGRTRPQDPRGGTMLAEIFGVDIFIILLFFVSLGVVIWAIVDVARQPAISPMGKTGWIAGLVVGTFLFGVIGLVIAVVYLAAVRPRLGAGA
jgi:hypothetical protein